MAFVRLNKSQVEKKIQFIDDYIASENAATGSKLDANANVSHKNIATLSAEINKDVNIQINRELLYRKIKELFGQEDAYKYLDQLESHELYKNDETSLSPYCVSISMYPFLLDGLTKMGGESKAPKHIESFCGCFVNLIFAISSQFAGAVATVEFLTYFDYFCRKDYGDNYLVTHEQQVKNHLQHVVYALNQPAAARGFQSVFWNISVFDKYYFESLFKDFVFPDMTPPKWETIDNLQTFFMRWFNSERKTALLTFPVVTAAVLTENNDVKDESFVQMLSKEMSEGNSFFVYMSDSPDSLASCCRLRNEMTDNTFSYSLGAGGVATGSISVMTLNLNRLVQNHTDLEWQIKQIHKYQVAYRKIVEGFLESGVLAAYDAGFIDLDKQFLTIGINGVTEAAESQGFVVGNNQEYKNYVSGLLKIIYKANREATAQYGYKFNTEFVPAESLGVKNAAWDKKDGFVVNRDCYNSYLYLVEDEDCSPMDKFSLHGKEINQFLDGGSALHLNLDHHPTQEGYRTYFKVAAISGCNYWTVNVKNTICNSCETIAKETFTECPTCGSKDVDYGTRVIGYLKRISNFSKERQKEAAKRSYL